MSNITVQKTDMIDSFKKLRADIIEHKEGLQKKIDNTMTQLTSNSKKVEKELLDVLTKLEDEAQKSSLKSRNASLILNYYLSLMMFTLLLPINPETSSSENYRLK